MESIKELRLICQAGRRVHDTWHGKYIARPLSIYITAIFLRLGISANMATGIFLINGIIGSILLVFPDKRYFFVGMLMMQVWYILDHVDGEIARYRKQTSLTGVYLDKITHYISHPFMFFCIGLGFYNSYGYVALVIAAFVAGYSITMISAMEDVFSSVIYYGIKNKKISISLADASPADNSKSKGGLLRRIFSILHTLCTFPSVMNLLFFASILDLFIRSGTVVGVVLFYAVFATVIWAARFFVFIKERKADTVSVIKEGLN
jgi:phosphatidylglycerophosphate synthase